MNRLVLPPGSHRIWQNSSAYPAPPSRHKTGNEFHLEWAIGYKFDNGLEIGVVGYDYRFSANFRAASEVQPKKLPRSLPLRSI